MGDDRMLLISDNAPLGMRVPTIVTAGIHHHFHGPEWTDFLDKFSRIGRERQSTTEEPGDGNSLLFKAADSFAGQPTRVQPLVGTVVVSSDSLPCGDFEHPTS